MHRGLLVSCTPSGQSQGSRKGNDAMQDTIQPEKADPLHSPRRGGTMYAVFIYNREVRDCVKDNEPHHTLSERWAEVQTHEVCADSAEEARELAQRRFPVRDGFVITGVREAVMH